MLTTVEQIEEAIISLLEQYDDELVSMHKKIEFIKEKAYELLEKKERELNEKYAEREDVEQARKEYLEEYSKAKARILEGAQRALERVSQSFLKKIEEEN